MNHLSVNGIELNLPVGPEAPFHELIHVLRNTLTSGQALISSVHVDGAEISGPEEVELASVPISQLKSVEVFTAHPREIAQETLQNLSEYILFLETLSKASADLIQGNEVKDEYHEQFAKLIDGISTFTEAISHVKKVLRIGLLQPIDVLEADLLSILKDILASQKNGQIAYIKELLQLHLPENLGQWREEGIPILIRSRDC